MLVNYMDAHSPYMPPSPYDSIYPGKRPGITTAWEYDLNKAVLRQQREVTQSERDHVVSQYDGGIAYIDDQLARLLDHLREAGRFEDALIVVTSDHGEEFDRRGLFMHGVSVYQSEIGVPLLIKYPGSNHAERLDAPCGSVDILPTILETVGVPVSDGLDGRSLRSPRTARARPLISESFPDGYVWSYHSRFRRIERSIIDWPHKLIVATDGRREAYDLAADPEESRNLVADLDVRKMEADLEAWLGAAPEHGDPPRMDPSRYEHLRALGYVH